MSSSSKAMDYRFVALDIDGTLVTKSHTISSANFEALQAVRRAGVLVTLATGRMFLAARPFAQQLNIDLPIITYQGSVIRSAMSGETLYRTDIEASLALDTVRYLETKPGRLFLYVDDLLVASAEDEVTERYLAHSSEVCLTLMPELSAWLWNDGNQRSLIKVVFIGESTQVASIQSELQRRFARRLELTRTYPNFLEIGPIGIHKGSALVWLANHYGIPLANTMAIGDSANDIDMFKVAGLAVAMGDAQEETKAAAHVLTSSCADDGVARALRSYVLSKGQF